MRQQPQSIHASANRSTIRYSSAGNPLQIKSNTCTSQYIDSLRQLSVTGTSNDYVRHGCLIKTANFYVSSPFLFYFLRGIWTTMQNQLNVFALWTFNRSKNLDFIVIVQFSRAMK